MCKRIQIILLISASLFLFYYFVVFIHDAAVKSSRNRYEIGDLVDFQLGNLIKNHTKIKFARKKLAVLVPFRDCFDELLQFVPHMRKFLTAKKIPHHVFAINQVDQFRLNRGALINVGFLYAKSKFDYIAIHDVDALPLNKQLPYEYPKHGVWHLRPISLISLHFSEAFLGGNLVMKNKDFEMVNGMSDHYWDLGLEGDEFRETIKKFGLKINRPHNLTTGENDTFHIHKPHIQRDKKKCKHQPTQWKDRVHNEGLNSTRYKIIEINEMAIDDSKVTVLNVELKCDRKQTPWCDCD